MRRERTSRAPNRVSLTRALSKLGLASRKQAELLIQSGSVSVDGKLERNPHRWVDLATVKIKVGEEQAAQKKFRYAVVHKPAGLVSTSNDELGRDTVYDIFPEELKGLRTVGRLDKDTSGLLIVTNDNQLSDFLTSPRSGIEKTYEVMTGSPLTAADLEQLRKGVSIVVEGQPVRTKPAEVIRTQREGIRLILTEGKNRQVRRMIEAIGNTVVQLKRSAVGPVQLGDLGEGKWRWMLDEELRVVKQQMQGTRNAVRPK